MAEQIEATPVLADKCYACHCERDAPEVFAQVERVFTTEELQAELEEYAPDYPYAMPECARHRQMTVEREAWLHDAVARSARGEVVSQMVDMYRDPMSGGW